MVIMKSAYELAMERLNASDPDTAKKPLSAKQKSALSEIDARYQAKFAEREIFLKKALQETLQRGEAEEAEKIHGQIASERARLDEERESEKNKVRSGSA